MVELLNIDCVEYMKTLADNSFDCAVVDPPYGINANNMRMGENLTRSDGFKRNQSTAVRVKNRLNHGKGKLKNRHMNNSVFEWDNAVPSDEYFTELFRVSKHQIIFGGNYFKLPPTRCVLCWDKKQPWENFSAWEMIWTSFDKPADLFSYSNTGGANNEKKIHPTQKPLAVYGWIFGKYIQRDWKVLDTHFGSGSSAIVSEKFGNDYVGCEINEQYFIDAKLRFQEQTYLGLFENKNILQ